MRQTLRIAALALMIPAAAQAHVSVTPRQSAAGATEKYTIRVPTEGKVATTGAYLEVPAGVIVEVVSKPAGWTYELTRKDDRIVAIKWTMDVQPGEFVEVALVARNPRDQKQIVWTLRQRFADGTVTDWTRTPNGVVRPTALTTLTPMQGTR